MKLKRYLLSIGIAAPLLAACSGTRSNFGPTARPVLPSDLDYKVHSQAGLVANQIDSLQLAIQTYRCKSMVNIVNQLRSLGKDQALKALRDYYDKKVAPNPQEIESQIRILAICRVLFQAPAEGWKEPWSQFNDEHGEELVQDLWRFSKDARAKFPCYPIVVSDGIPFYLSDGYMRPQGLPAISDEAIKCLDRCQTLDLITADIPTNTYDRASLRLISSAAFTALLSSNSAQGQDFSVIPLWIVFEAIDPDYVTFHH